MFGMEGIINDITLSVERTWIMQNIEQVRTILERITSEDDV